MKNHLALEAITAAEAGGRLRPGGIIVEYTGGTTGVSLAFGCAANGYRSTIRFSDTFSQDKGLMVQALARWLAHQLVESRGRGFPTRPVVLVPGWFIELATKRAPDVWVLIPKQLSAHIAREPVALKREAVALVASGIIHDMQKQ